MSTTQTLMWVRLCWSLCMLLRWEFGRPLRRRHRVVREGAVQHVPILLHPFALLLLWKYRQASGQNYHT